MHGPYVGDEWKRSGEGDSTPPDADVSGRSIAIGSFLIVAFAILLFLPPASNEVKLPHVNGSLGNAEPAQDGRHSELLTKAGDLLRANKVAEAESVYREIERLYPKLPSAATNVGVCLIYQDKHAAAEEQYRRALRLDPTYARAHYALGSVLSQTKRYADAVEHLEYALARGHDPWRVHFALAGAHDRLKHSAKAIHHYQAYLLTGHKDDELEAHARKRLEALRR